MAQEETPELVSTLAVVRREECLREYYRVQEAISEHDNRSIQIKSWSVTVIAASAGAAISQDSPMLYGLGAIAAVGFWLIDALWKSFQVVWIKRGVELEKILSSSGPIEYGGPQIHASFQRRFKNVLSWLYLVPCMLKANVYLPHFPAAAGLAIVCWAQYGWAGLELVTRR